MITKYFIAAIIMLSSFMAVAQKKVTPVTQSALTGVLLPEGSKQDKRLLMEAAAQVLLEMESKKAGTAIKTIEILYLPSVVACGFNADSLVNKLTALGWNITPVEDDNKFVWLQKDNRSVLTYLSTDKKQTELYFGETDAPPNLNGGGNNISSQNIPN